MATTAGTRQCHIKFLDILKAVADQAPDGNSSGTPALARTRI